MTKQRVSAAQLVEMSAGKIGATGSEITIRKDHSEGWQPVVVSAPGSLIFFQREAENIAKHLRMDYELRD